MENILYQAHSGWRWVAFIAVLVAIGYGLWGWLGNRRWTPAARRVALFTTIALDIQILLGLVVYAVGSRWEAIYARGVRFEHPLIMILALVAVHVTSARIRRGTNDGPRYRVLAVGTLITLVLIVVGIALLPGGTSRLFEMTAS